jgi:hypothetical protein
MYLPSGVTAASTGPPLTGLAYSGKPKSAGVTLSGIVLSRAYVLSSNTEIVCP